MVKERILHICSEYIIHVGLHQVRPLCNTMLTKKCNYKIMQEIQHTERATNHKVQSPKTNQVQDHDIQLNFDSSKSLGPFLQV